MTGLPRTEHASRTESLPKASTRATSSVSRNERGRIKGIGFAQRELSRGIKRERQVEERAPRLEKPISPRGGSSCHWQERLDSETAES